MIADQESIGLAAMAQVPRDRFGYTIPEAAEYFGVTTATMRRWIHDGRIDAWRITSQVVRVDVASVRAERVMPRG